MRVFKIGFYTALFPGILIITGCSPIPLIQSPRIDSKVAISASVKSNGVNNINYADEKVKSKHTFMVDEKTPLFLTLGILKRAELSGMFFPYWNGILWQGNLKVTLFEIGNDNLKNLASAMFVGSTGYTGEHEDVYNYYGGLSFGSIANLGISEFEFILQSSGSKEQSISSYGDHYTIYWLQPAFGISCKPSRNKIVQVDIGVNYSYPIKSDVLLKQYNCHSTSEIRYFNSANGGFSFLGTLRFNIVR